MSLKHRVKTKDYLLFFKEVGFGLGLLMLGFLLSSGLLVSAKFDVGPLGFHKLEESENTETGLDQTEEGSEND
jgi:hypothetical protein